MLCHKKEIFLRRRTINGQNSGNMPLPVKLTEFVSILNNLVLSRAFDNLFGVNRQSEGIVVTRQGKVDKNLFDYLLKRNETSFSDLRSRSPLVGSKSIYSRHSRSRTPLKKLRVKKKKQNGSLANFSQKKVTPQANLYMSQNLNQNPNFFKLASEQEIPLSSVDNTKKGRRLPNTI